MALKHRYDHLQERERERERGKSGNIYVVKSFKTSLFNLERYQRWGQGIIQEIY